MTQPVHQRRAPQQSSGISGNELYKRIVKVTNFLVKKAKAAPQKYEKEIEQAMDLTKIAKARDVSFKAPVEKAKKLVQAAKEKDLSKIAYATADLIATVEGQAGNMLSAVGGTKSLLESLQSDHALLNRLKDTILSGTKSIGETVGTSVALPIQLLSKIATAYKQTKSLQQTNAVLAKVEEQRDTFIENNLPELGKVLGKDESKKIKEALDDPAANKDFITDQVMQKLHRVKNYQIAGLISTLFTILSVIAAIVVARYAKAHKIWALIPTGVTVVTMGITVGTWAKSYFETTIEYKKYRPGQSYEMEDMASKKTHKNSPTPDFAQMHRDFKPEEIQDKGNKASPAA